MSQYYYVRKNAHNPLHEQVVGEDMSISEFVASGIAPGMNNGQCRFLHGDMDDYPFGDCPSELLDEVLANIDAHFLWVGIMEQFDASLLLLSRLLGWQSPPHYIRKNVSKTRTTVHTLEEADREVIEAYNALDIRLYDMQSARLAQSLAAIDDFDDNLEAFKDKNRRLAGRWGWLPDRLQRFVTL
jgi:hypothetical protein